MTAAVAAPRSRARIVRAGSWSIRVDSRAAIASSLLVAALLLVAIISVCVGDVSLPVGDALRALFGHGDASDCYVVRELRAPRIVGGAVVGAGLASAGVLFQSITRNPLGTPDVVGLTSGAAAGGVFVILVGAGSAVTIGAGALAGGVLAAATVYALAWRRGVTGYRLVLVGIGVGAVLAAVTQFLVTRADIRDAQRATVWLVGSLSGLRWSTVIVAAVVIGILVPFACAQAQSMRLLALGDDVASGLGARVQRTRLAIALLGVALASIATATSGPIGFVALASPHLARRVAGPGGSPVVTAALIGALLVVAADLVARRAFAPVELPVGVATAALGGPYLLVLLARQLRQGAL